MCGSRRGLARLLVLTVIVLVALGVLVVSSNPAPTRPLVNESFKPIPRDLSWYPVVVFGDNRPSFTHYIKYNRVFYKIISDVETINPVAVIGTGDHVGEGRETQYEELYRVLKNLSNVWLVPGNHDFHWTGSRKYWAMFVGPTDYLETQIPGWVFVMVDTTVDNATLLNESLSMISNNLEAMGGNRSLVLVEHYPIEPWLDHNLNQTDAGPGKQSILLGFIKKYNVSLVLQGHWHGYAEKRIGDTTYIVTGGAGAPLYKEPSSTDADKIVTGLYHYMVFIFYPNGTFTYTTVYPNYGVLKLIKIKNNTVLIYQTRLTLERKPATLPFRFTLENNGTNIEILALVDSGKPELVTLTRTNPIVIETTPGVHSIQVISSGQVIKQAKIHHDINTSEALAIWNALATNTTTVTTQTNTLTASPKSTTSSHLGKTTMTQESPIKSMISLQNNSVNTLIKKEPERTGGIKLTAGILAIIVVVTLILVALYMKR